MNPELTDALDRARKLEIDGARFYTQAAETCESEAGTRMFLSFADDERRHLRVINDVAAGLGVDLEGRPLPREEIRTIFGRAAERLDDHVKATISEKEAITTAMGMERESYGLYAQAAKDATDEVTRKLLERLAVEENQHYEMLENTLEYLNANDEWFLWNEWALVEGDRSSLGAE